MRSVSKINEWLQIPVVLATFPERHFLNILNFWMISFHEMNIYNRYANGAVASVIEKS
jgi:hypothetical protein